MGRPARPPGSATPRARPTPRPASARRPGPPHGCRPRREARDRRRRARAAPRDEPDARMAAGVLQPRSQAPSTAPGRARASTSRSRTRGRSRAGEPGNMAHHGADVAGERHHQATAWCIPRGQRISSGVSVPLRWTPRRMGRGGPLLRHRHLGPQFLARLPDAGIRDVLGDEVGHRLGQPRHQPPRGGVEPDLGAPPRRRARPRWSRPPIWSAHPAIFSRPASAGRCGERHFQPEPNVAPAERQIGIEWHASAPIRSAIGPIGQQLGTERPDQQHLDQGEREPGATRAHAAGPAEVRKQPAPGALEQVPASEEEQAQPDETRRASELVHHVGEIEDEHGEREAGDAQIDSLGPAVAEAPPDHPDRQHRTPQVGNGASISRRATSLRRPSRAAATSGRRFSRRRTVPTASGSSTATAQPSTVRAMGSGRSAREGELARSTSVTRPAGRRDRRARAAPAAPPRPAPHAAPRRGTPTR